MLAWLASFPRSGNTCTRHVLEQVYGLVTLDEELRDASGRWQISADDWAQSPSGRIGLRQPPAASPAELMQLPDWYLIKTHAENVATDEPALLVVRDGRDALLSYAWFALQIVEGRRREEINADLVHRMLEGLIRYPRPRYGTWGSHTLNWLDRPQTVVIRFEDLVQRPAEVVGEGLRRLGIPCRATGQAPPDFATLKRIFPEFYRSGQVGQWRTGFPADLLDLFWSLNREPMQRLGYDEDVATAA